MHLDESDEYVVRCSDHESLHRAISLVNIQFSFLLILVTIFAMSFYLILVRRYGGEKVEYVFLTKEEHYREEDGFVKPNNDVESQSQEKSMREQI